MLTTTMRRVIHGKKAVKSLSDWPEPKSIPGIPFKRQRINALIYDVYDGDTCSVMFRFGGEFLKYKIRVLGVDTPEISMRGEKNNTPIGDFEEEVGKYIRDKVKDLIEGRECDVIFDKWDKYGGRVNGTIFIDGDVTLTDYLLEKGYAKPYDGKKKEDWTREQLEEILSGEKSS